MSYTRDDIDAAIADIEEGDAAQSIEELAAITEDNSGQQFLDFGDTLNLAVKGSKPTDSEIKIKAVSRPIKGQVGDDGDDEVVTLLVTARLDKLEFITKRSGDGGAASKTRRGTYTPISVLPVTAEQADQILGLSE
jgi:hypothetical protein